MRRLVANILLAGLLHAAASPAVAADATPAAPAGARTLAIVQSVDPVAGKVSLRVPAGADVEAAPLAIVVQVDDPALLRRLHAGDKVILRVIQTRGEYRVLGLEPAK